MGEGWGSGVFRWVRGGLVARRQRGMVPQLAGCVDFLAASHSLLTQLPTHWVQVGAGAPNVCIHLEFAVREHY